MLDDLKRMLLKILRSQQPLNVLLNIDRQNKIVPGSVFDFGNGKRIRYGVLGHSFPDGTSCGSHFNVGKGTLFLLMEVRDVYAY